MDRHELTSFMLNTGSVRRFYSGASAAAVLFGLGLLPIGLFAQGPTFTSRTTTATTQAAGDSSSKIANTAFVTAAINSAIAGVNPAVAVQAATTTVLPAVTYFNGVAGIGATLTQNSAAVLVLDGYTPVLLDRLLIKNQASAFQNGVYFISTLGTGIIPFVLTRALDYDQPSDINNTGAIPVVNGIVNALTSWLLTSLVTTIGTDPLTYTQFSINPSVTTQTIASGTSALGTGAISGNACATVVTTTATGTAATDAISWSPNADISGVTGYGVASTDGLKVYPYPTTNNVNWRVCNGTGSSITPGAVTLNWRVTR
jgi:hypothetical protein